MFFVLTNITVQYTLLQSANVCLFEYLLYVAAEVEEFTEQHPQAGLASLRCTTVDSALGNKVVVIWTCTDRIDTEHSEVCLPTQPHRAHAAALPSDKLEQCRKWICSDTHWQSRLIGRIMLRPVRHSL